MLPRLSLPPSLLSPPISLYIYLGVIVDDEFNFGDYIYHICRIFYYHNSDLRRIRRYLSLSIARIIASALVSRGLRYLIAIRFFVILPLGISQNYNVFKIA